MSYADSKYSCWWALPSSKQFSWFCRTARIITLLASLSFNCNIYYVHYLKCSINQVPDVSCSSQNSVCLKVWLYLAWKIRGFVQKQEAWYSVGPLYNLHWLFHFQKPAPPSPPTHQTSQAWCRPGFSRSWWCLLALLKNLKNFAVSKNVETVEFSEWRWSAFSATGIC